MLSQFFTPNNNRKSTGAGGSARSKKTSRKQISSPITSNVPEPWLSNMTIAAGQHHDSLATAGHSHQLDSSSSLLRDSTISAVSVHNNSIMSATSDEHNLMSFDNLQEDSLMSFDPVEGPLVTMPHNNNNNEETTNGEVDNKQGNGSSDTSSCMSSNGSIPDTSNSSNKLTNRHAWFFISFL
jgi:hypothetical protein